MTTAWTRTREQLAADVLFKLRLIAPGDTPDSAVLTAVYAAMDARLKELYALSLLPWKLTAAPVDVAILANTQTVSLSAITDMLYPLTLNINLTGHDYPVDIVSNLIWQQIPNKTTAGMPDTAHLEGSTLYLSPLPDTAYTGKLTYQKIMDDTAASTAPDAMAGTMKCLTDILAGDLADGLVVDDARYASIKAEAGTLDGPNGPTGAFRRLLKVINRPQTITTQQAEYF